MSNHRVPDGRNDVEDEDQSAEKPQQKEYQKKQWNEHATFETKADCDKFLEDNQHWKKQSTRSGYTGVKTRYYCKSVSRAKGKEGCPAELLVHSLANSEKIVVYTGLDHVHPGEPDNARIAVSNEVKAKIRSMHSDKMKPRMIYIKLQQDNEIQNKPTANQVWYSEVKQVVLSLISHFYHHINVKY